MSKHPTSELSPRDRACIEYGKLVGEFEDYFGWLPNPFLWDGDARYTKREFLKDLREARERIFRECDNCVHEDALDCTVRKERLIDCHGYRELAPTCRHYKERRAEKC